MEVLIELRNLSVSYDDHVALENVDLDIFSGDFLGVIGPNGGGKTTLVKAIMGTLKYLGMINYSPSLLAPHGKSIGYLPQQSNFDKSFPISVQEIVKSGVMSENGFIKPYSKLMERKAAELMELTGIKNLARRTLGEISGGQLQRAMLCRALISNPKLLILDEPANFVDNKFEKELYEILKVLNDKIAIVMVSHDIGTISSVVKSIVCVNKHVHRHNSNIITPEQLHNYDCPIQLVYHGKVPHVVLGSHN